MRLQRGARQIVLPCVDGLDNPPCRLLLCPTAAIVCGYRLKQPVDLAALHADCALGPVGSHWRTTAGDLMVELQGARGRYTLVFEPAV